MLYGIYKIQDILNKSNFLFGNPNVDMECMKKLSNYDIAYDFIELYRIVSEIKVIIDKMIQEGDENNELQRSTGTDI